MNPMLASSRSGAVALVVIATACARRPPPLPLGFGQPPDPQGPPPGATASQALGALSGPPTTPAPVPALGPVYEAGEASYYADSLAGRPTASGAPYDPAALTA
ncbi:MAG: hypothetical protein KC731_38530, partial [Myxococcales bacterium]|nr:hypothetical protein [Myxococcales bacterium]